MDWHPIQGRVEIPPITSCYRNLGELRPDDPLGSYSDLRTFARKFSNIDFSLRILPLKVDELVMSEK